MELVAFKYCPDPKRPLFEEGVTAGRLVLWSGEPGPAISIPMAALMDDEGEVVFEPTGDPQEITVIRD